MSNLKKILSFIVIGLSFMIFVGCGKAETTENIPNDKKIDETKNNEKDVVETKEEIKDVELVEDSIKFRNEFTQAKFFIDGVVKNNSEKTLKGMILEIKYQNDNGDILKTSEYSIEVDGTAKSDVEFSTEFIDASEVSFTKFDATVKDYTLE
ncbi:hypothetical protein [Clostridium sp.]|uniref:hypothetical protein n=1 Tax=Clostridium sp. TaxID=1506 RepID=UPI002906EC88|nr:hypothetical protein [Clostridium sp.]MDU3410107.1 hypothetical protein [Clostridium sp.]